MESIKRLRIHLRSSYTKTANKLNEFIKTEVINEDELLILCSQLTDKWLKLESCDKELINILKTDVNISDEDFEKEFESMDNYSEMYIGLKTKVEILRQKLHSKFDNSIINEDKGNINRKYKLPKIELKKFSGEISEWLGFWGQFRKIDEDNELDPEDKFQYLIQSTVEGSKARDIVQSFPPTADNYKLAIEHLRSRFGRDDVLVEVYVRELLRLVLNNAVNPERKSNLLKLYDKIEAHLRALETLGVTTDKYAAMLYPLVEACLPEEILRTWERNYNFMTSKKGTEISKLEMLMQFLRCEVEGEERISLVRQGFGFEKQKKIMFSKTSANKDIPTATELFSGYKKHMDSRKNNACVFCENKHFLEDCKSFQKIPFEEKKNVLIKKGCCFTCLRTGHISQMCKNPLRCTKCSRRHRAVMCPELNSSNQHVNLKNDQSEKNDSKDHILSNKTCTEDVVMQTLNVRLRGKDEELIIRVLIDTGSQKSYLKRETALSIGYIPLGEEKVNHCLFGGVEAMETHQRYRVFLTSLCGDYKCNFEVYDQEKICSNIPRIRNGPWIKELNHYGISLNDCAKLKKIEQSNEEEIHLLIGSDVAGKLLTGNIIQLSNGLVAVHTRLGWTLMGKLPQEEKRVETLSIFSLFCNETKMSDLWNLDILGITDPSEKQTKTEIEKAAKEHFLRSLTRDAEGRYEVSLPWLQGHESLQSNKQIAERRIKSTVKSLQSNGYLSAYEEVFKEWLEEDIIETVDVPEKDDTKCLYLPHRAVVKPNATTKIRPVFDASAKEKNCVSLNDCLEKGPNFIELIPSILNRFRLRKYGVTADIRRAFLQIGIKKKDRDFLRFLWWEEGNPEKLRIFRHRRVVFGVNASPFLLGATLDYHLENVPAHLLTVAEKLKESMYVDNCVASLDSIEDLNEFIEKAREIMAAGKFDLRGWTFCKPLSEFSMKENVKTDLPTFNIKASELEEETASVLGLRWNVIDDKLSCDLKDISDSYNNPVTKRSILSIANKIFDPIGFLSPVTLIPKILMQECWRAKLSWDAELPNNLAQKFQKWQKSLATLKDVSIPRRILLHFDSETKLSFHVFCDASQISYATCVYLREENEAEVSCQLVQARSRVAPLRAVTISRLELLACCIGVRLMESIKRDLHFEQVPTFYWSDSMNVIFWIKNHEPWATFVMNRVKEIRSLTRPDEWNHVPGYANPADLPSRGCSPDILISRRWWEGPRWLLDPEETWPKSEIYPCTDVVNSEKKKIVATSTQVHLEYESYYSRFSSYIRILRITAWIYRFYLNIRAKDSQTRGDLTNKELKNAELVLMRLVQKEEFPKGIDARIRPLHPYVDEMGLIRVKTQIFQRKDKKNFRLPILLPSEHYIVHKLIVWKHKELKHAGVQILMNNLRENYWILRSRKTIKKVLKHCVNCRRFTAPSSETESPPLPEDRVRDAAAFEISGVDLAGPLFLKGGQKCWIVLFTCAVYRAIHLELITSLSTGAFFQSLRRFIARRGRPFVIYSDNGTNFVGASNTLANIDWANLLCEMNLKDITWKFIPPASPWWGGWWERLVAMIKYILRRVLGKASLHYEEFYTLLCDTESLINSRPLTLLSEDVEDLIPLTPNMFLHELKEVGVPDIDNIDKINIRKRYAYLQKVREDLRKRFRSEYLGHLKYPNKSVKHGPAISVGDIVLVGCDNQKRFQWPLARVIELYPGKDGLVRVAKVKTRSGEQIRPVQRLHPLEMTTNEGSIFRDKLLSESSVHRLGKDLELNGEISDVQPKETDKKSSLTIEQSFVDSPPHVTSRCGRPVKPPKRLNL